jgi:predicted MFS family arabinose efflux permease
VGGALAQAFGWRSVFVPLAGICVLTGVFMLLFTRRETHPYFVLTRLAKQGTDVKCFEEWEAVMAHKRKFDAPWVPLK